MTLTKTMVGPLWQAFVLLSCAIFLFATPADALRFEPLGVGSISPGPGMVVGSVPTDLSADGGVVVGYVYQSQDGEIPGLGSAFRWEDGAMQELPGCSSANSVSADGSVIAGKCTEDNYWRDGAFVSAGVWDPLDGGSVNVVSGDAKVLFGVRTERFLDDFNQVVGLSQAQVLVPELTPIGTLAGDKMSIVVGASFDGAVAAVASSVQELVHPERLDVLHAARWDGALSDLGKITSFPDVFPIDVSSDGSTVIGFNGPRAWRWTQSDGMVSLPLPEGGSVANARGVNKDGSVVVGAWDGPGLDIQRAYIWTPETGSRDLQDYFEQELGVDLQGWHLAEASVVSDDGSTFAGIGFAPDSSVPTGWRVGEGCQLRIEVEAMFVPYAETPRQFEPAAGGEYPPGAT